MKSSIYMLLHTAGLSLFSSMRKCPPAKCWIQNGSLIHLRKCEMNMKCCEAQLMWMQSIHCSDWPGLSVWRGGNPLVFIQSLDDNNRQTYKHRKHKDRQTGCGGHSEYKNTLMLFWPSFSSGLRAATNGQQSFCLVDLELSSPPLLLCSMWNTNLKAASLQLTASCCLIRNYFQAIWNIYSLNDCFCLQDS